MVVVCGKDIFSFLDHLVVGSVGGLMSEIDVSEVGKVDVHFAYILEKLGSVEFVFGLELDQKYVEGERGLGEFDEELGDFAFLEDEYLGYGPKRRKFLKNLFIGQLEYYSLVDTDQKHLARVLLVGFAAAHPRV